MTTAGTGRWLPGHLTVLLTMLQIHGAAVVVAQQSAQLDDGDIPDGWMIIEGDILVPDDFYSNTAAAYMTTLWGDGIVPYEFDTDGDDAVSSAQQQVMLNAMSRWTAVAAITFRPHEDFDTGWLRVRVSTSSNSSPVGAGIGERTVNIMNWSEWTCVHELGHALGLWHEQSRPNRDSYVHIEEDRIDIWDRHNFDRHDDAKEYPRNGYDFDSIMHYGQCSFSLCTTDCDPVCDCAVNPGVCRTITVLSPWDTQWQSAIGQRAHLSHFDALTMSFMYPEHDWLFVDRAYDGMWENGTLWEPFKTFDIGYTETATGGTLWIEPGSYAALGTWSKGVTLRAPRGGVRLGD